MHKVFISHHHENDQGYKESLVQFGKKHRIFVDRSVDTGDISDDLSDKRIREKIRDGYLRDSTVTIVLVGTETKRRKHVDWEIYSSMFNGEVNKKSGILVVNLPSIDNGNGWAAHGASEKATVFPDCENWMHLSARTDFEAAYPHMPARIVDSLVVGAKISVVGWKRLTAARLKFLVDVTFAHRASCEYDLSEPMRRKNS